MIQTQENTLYSAYLHSIISKFEQYFWCDGVVYEPYAVNEWKIFMDLSKRNFTSQQQ